MIEEIKSDLDLGELGISAIVLMEWRRCDRL